MDRKTSKNIICFGSLIMDISIRCDKIPAMGETVYTYEDYNVNWEEKAATSRLPLPGPGQRDSDWKNCG